MESDTRIIKRAFKKTIYNTIQYNTIQDKTRQDKTRQDKTRQDKTRQDNTIQYNTIQYNTMIYLMSITSGKVALIPEPRAHVENARLYKKRLQHLEPNSRTLLTDILKQDDYYIDVKKQLCS